jgi:hypothetical protein
LLPALQIRHVSEQITIRDRREALKTMPKRLDAAFQTTIDRIQNQSDSRKRQGMDTLRWVFLAERQLTLEELRHALSIMIGDRYLDEDGFPTLASIIDCCLGLAIIDEGMPFIRLVHKSLQDFFEKQYRIGELFPRGHKEIADICLTYMSFDRDFHLDEEKSLFRNYAVLNWGRHIKKSKEEVTEEQWQSISSFLINESAIGYDSKPWSFDR